MSVKGAIAMGKNNGSNNDNDSKCIQPLEFVCQTETTVYEFPLCTDSGILINSDGYKETSLYSAVFEKGCWFTERYLMTFKDNGNEYNFICYGPHPDDSAYKPVVVDGDIKIRDYVFVTAVDRTSPTSVKFHSMSKEENVALFRHLAINIIRNTHKFPGGACGSGYTGRSVCIKDVKITECGRKVAPGESYCTVE